MSKSASCSSKKEIEERLQERKFLDHAAKHWGEHARVVESKLWSKRKGYRKFDCATTTLHYAASFGLYITTQELLSKLKEVLTIAVNKIDNMDHTALQYAAAHGHFKTAKLLLDQGADVNTQIGNYGNALQAASFEGYEQIVKLVLDHGANVNA